MSIKYLKQIMILDDKAHQLYLGTFVEETMNFEAFINFMLGTLYDTERPIESIVPNQDATTICIIYLIPIT